MFGNKGKIWVSEEVMKDNTGNLYAKARAKVVPLIKK